MRMKELDAEKIKNLKTAVIYSTLGVGTVTGLFFLARHFYKKTQTNRSEQRSLNEGDPATLAKQLKMAFDNDNSFGWGTNETMIKKVFEELPSKSLRSEEHT